MSSQKCFCDVTITIMVPLCLKGLKKAALIISMVIIKTCGQNM